MTENAGFDDTMGLYRVFVIAGFALMVLNAYSALQGNPPSLLNTLMFGIGYYMVGGVLATVRYTDQLTRIDPPPLVITAGLWPLLITIDAIEYLYRGDTNAN